MKKFLANQTPDINYYRANVVLGDTVIDALDLTDLRKLLLKDTEVSENDIKVGMALYHSKIGDWDTKYATTYGSESSFINYYRVSSMREADAVKNANGMCWIWVNDGLFFDAETGEWLVSYEEEFKTMVQNYKDAGLWDVIAGFETEEATSRISQEQYIMLTKFISEICPEKRILACTSPWEITGYESEDGTIDIEPLTKEALQYVTDIGYDEYHRTDEEYHRELLAKMKAVAPDDARIWFFPCTNRLSTASHWYTDEEHMLASLNVTYKLLLEQENPGGLYLYSWDTYIEGAEGLDQLLDPNGEYNFSELGNRIVEIGGEILTGENAQ
ncbi:MAG: hypothetical protein J6Q67_07355, partial [Clostridia bacterium]|nr:hypothetical protein [Clostridia bacterium]